MTSRTLLAAALLALAPAVAATESAPKGATPPAGQPHAAVAAPKPKDDKTQPLTVDAKKMERFGKESLVVFSGNVVARRDNSVQYADRVEVYMDEKGDRVVRTVSTGSVRILTRDCRTGTAQRAEYYEPEQRVVLIGDARVWQEDNVVSGDTITIFLSEDRTTVEGGKQERVKAVFYPRDEQKRNDQASARRPADPCKN
ncbi:MAG TPA: lipopolysaccharide transport periplasmic protein LptA [Candidatus Binatia bacterium]|nr:lipopolysaccharide transport periplasmic protein LptA [Candidatus Binatia bacterium]